MKRSLILWGVVLLTLVLAQEAQSQWRNGNLALRTNGNSFQSGDRLKVEVLALETINEPFFTQVSYRFAETVREKDKDGHETTKQEERTSTRPTGPVLESLDQFRLLSVDDTFHFGEASPAGRYTIEVGVFRGYTKERLATLRSCVVYQNGERPTDACPLHLRSLKRANSEEWLIFDGNFSVDGRYSATLLSGTKVIKYLEGNIGTSGSHEITIASHLLTGVAGKTYDILLHDHSSNRSSTLSRVTIPAAP